jgi:hypothetical protein
LSTRASDATVRVLVGKLGAGKTVYLRRLQSFQAHQDSVYADEPQQSLPSTELIVRACQWFPEQYLTEKWMQLWHRAILRSLTTHLLREKNLKGHVSLTASESLRRNYGKLLGGADKPRSIYSQLRAIINEAHTSNQLTRYLEDDRWDDLEYELGEVLRTCPPIFFYLDAVDEEFHHAPMYWLRCQKGLFYQTMRLLRDARLGGRLHIVICIRDIVLSSVYASEHAPRYHDEPHIRILDWTVESLEYLLRAKIAALPPAYRMTTAEGSSSIESWLGTAWVHNDRRRVDESLDDYLLRHTRMIPRDLVSLGNALCKTVVQQKAYGSGEFPPDRLRDVVARSAKRFGDSQLAQCANQLSADLMPRLAAIRGYSDTYTGSQEYTRSLRDGIKQLLRDLEVDTFDLSALEKLDTAADQLFAAPSHLSAILWQNGLLGFLDHEEQPRFYSLADMDQFDIPKDADFFVLHPCVLDSVSGLRGAGARPIHPYRRH